MDSNLYFSCIKDVHSGVKTLLSFVGNIKGLASIRDAVYDLLKVDANISEVMFIRCIFELSRGPSKSTYIHSDGGRGGQFKSVHLLFKYIFSIV